MKTNYNILYVRWTDASSTADTDWKNVEVYKDLSLLDICSVGFMVEEDEECLTLVSHLSEDDTNGCGDICIPKACIKEMYVLGEENE